jgi:3-deoxy-D-manno-octulosonate 8-phosphate phosphatase (KDO 8-P phosphatase)
MAANGGKSEARTTALLAPVRLLVLDVDGTLTDGSVATTHEDEVQRFNVRDGFGIVEAQKQGLIIAWISGRGSLATERRASDLRISEVHLRARDKAAALRGIQARLHIAPAATAAMGDDLPDLALRPCVALFAAPADAVAEVLARADLVTQARGGQGAVREFIELILRSQGRWQAVVDAYGG